MSSTPDTASPRATCLICGGRGTLHARGGAATGTCPLPPSGCGGSGTVDAATRAAQEAQRNAPSALAVFYSSPSSPLVEAARILDAGLARPPGTIASTPPIASPALTVGAALVPDIDPDKAGPLASPLLAALAVDDSKLAVPSQLREVNPHELPERGRALTPEPDHEADVGADGAGVEVAGGVEVHADGVVGGHAKSIAAAPPTRKQESTAMRGTVDLVACVGCQRVVPETDTEETEDGTVCRWCDEEARTPLASPRPAEAEREGREAVEISCDECRKPLGPPTADEPAGGRRWCSTACADKATADDPRWIPVGDLTPAQRAELDRVLTPPIDMPSPEVAAALLDHLRNIEHRPFTNPFGDRVWLKPCLDEDGKRTGLTECCLVEEPCENHAAMPHGGAS